MAIMIDAHFDWPESDDLLRACNLGSGGKVQMAIDNAVASYCMMYTPYRTGTLARSPFTYEMGIGAVVYDTPYARRLYYNPGFNFNRTINSMAGAYWFERMKADHAEDIRQEALKVARGK